MKSLEKFIKKALIKKKPVHVKHGVFKYCPEERLIRGVATAYYITLNVDKKTYYFKEFPTNKVDAGVVEELYYDILGDLLDNNLIVCQYLSSEYLLHS
ncbi:hypothetical protein GF352_00405 [archaeon]|nr:hypothetical protein [archaeon]